MINKNNNHGYNSNLEIVKQKVLFNNINNNDINNSNNEDFLHQSSESEYYFKYDEATNFGIKLWRDGSKFFGSFKNYLANGWGTFHHYNSEIFKGEFVNNQVCGYGEYLHKNGYINIGLWENDVQIGIGYEIMGDSCFYSGEFIDGKKKWNRKLYLGR